MTQKRSILLRSKLLPLSLSIACATIFSCHGTDTCYFSGMAYTTTSRPEPAMGWTSWSFLRGDPTEASIQAQAQALHDSHLSDHGYIFVNVDDYYYEDPSKAVDSYGRWVTDPTRFPSGMAATAAFVHHLGLSFGMYVTPGIPVAAVNLNTPIEGTSYHAADIAAPGSYEIIYSFHNSMVNIDYTKPGAQSFIDSWAKLLASYGVDYLKLDGVGTFDIPDVQAWSQALAKSGRAIHFEISKLLAQSSGCIWSMLANGWRIDDVEREMMQARSVVVRESAFPGPSPARVDASNSATSTVANAASPSRVTSSARATGPIILIPPEDLPSEASTPRGARAPSSAGTH